MSSSSNIVNPVSNAISNAGTDAIVRNAFEGNEPRSVLINLIKSNPQLMQLYRSNPGLVFKFAFNPTILEAVRAQPSLIYELTQDSELISKFSANPNLLKEVSRNPRLLRMLLDKSHLKTRGLDKFESAKTTSRQPSETTRLQEVKSQRLEPELIAKSKIEVTGETFTPRQEKKVMFEQPINKLPEQDLESAKKIEQRSIEIKADEMARGISQAMFNFAARTTNQPSQPTKALAQKSDFLKLPSEPKFKIALTDTTKNIISKNTAMLGYLAAVAVSANKAKLLAKEEDYVSDVEINPLPPEQIEEVHEISESSPTRNVR